MRSVTAAEPDDEYDIDDNSVIVHTTKSDVTPEADPFTEKASVVKSYNGISSGKRRSITVMEKNMKAEMEKRYEGKDGSKSKRIEDDVITGYNAFEVVAPPYNLDYLSKLYEKSAAHYAAVNAKVANIVGLGFDFVPSNTTNQYLNERGDDKKWVERFNKKLQKARVQLLELFDSMNEEDTFSEVLQKVWKDYEATGNGYIEVGRTDTGAIGYIGHVPAKTVRIRRERDGFVQIISNKAVFFRNLGATDANPLGGDDKPNELIHIKKYSPSSTFYGVPDIISALSAVAGNEFSTKYNLDYFENKAVPRHVIVLKGATINPRLAKNILEFFETGLKGENHRSLFIPLPGDTPEKKVELKIEPVESGVQDASFNNYRKANLSEILMAHRVPISKVSTAEGASLAIARDADKTFKENVCQPEQRIFEKKINKITKEFTDLFVLKLNEMALTDENTQSQIDERRRKTGTETANEQRLRRGLPAIKGGDELVDMNAAAKKALSDSRANRERDTERSAAATDSAGEGRNSKGSGRASESGTNQ